MKKTIPFPKFVKALAVLEENGYDQTEAKSKWDLYNSLAGRDLVNALKDDDEPEAERIDGMRGVELINDFFTYLTSRPDESSENIPKPEPIPKEKD